MSRFSFKASESRTRRLALVFLLALVTSLAVIAAGCGGDDDDETSADTATTDTGEAAGGEGTCDKSIWVLLPDSASSPRWETDDRRYFTEAFEAAGVEHNIVNAEGDATQQQSQAEKRELRLVAANEKRRYEDEVRQHQEDDQAQPVYQNRI